MVCLFCLPIRGFFLCAIFLFLPFDGAAMLEIFFSDLFVALRLMRFFFILFFLLL